MATRSAVSIRALPLLAAPALLLTACASAPEAGSGGPAARLPAGEGRDTLEQACTGCHDLSGLAAYRGYYDESRWRAMIATMESYGAELNETEAATVAEYLAEHFGPGSR